MYLTFSHCKKTSNSGWLKLQHNFKHLSHSACDMLYIYILVYNIGFRFKYLDISDFINRDNNSSRLPIGFEKLDVESFGF